MEGRLSVAGVVRDGDRFLVALRKPGGSLGSCWEFPGGKVERGERPEEGLVREFREELDVDIDVGGRISDSRFVHNGETFRLLAFSVHLNGEIGELSEHVRIDWLPVSEIALLPLAPSDRPVLDVLMRMMRDDPDS